MADFFGTDDLGAKDSSPLKTGNTRRKYNSPCGKGYNLVKGKCVRKKRGSKTK